MYIHICEGATTRRSVDPTSELCSVGHSGTEIDIIIREAFLTLSLTNAALLFRGYSSNWDFSQIFFYTFIINRTERGNFTEMNLGKGRRAVPRFACNVPKRARIIAKTY
jgi:hypothetical protein